MTPSDSDPSESAGTSLVRLFGFAMLGLLLIYLFSTGPITRYQPQLADKLYAPLSPLVRNKAMGSIFLAWLKIWGVDTGTSPPQIVPSKPPPSK